MVVPGAADLGELNGPLRTLHPAILDARVRFLALQEMRADFYDGDL